MSAVPEKRSARPEIMSVASDWKGTIELIAGPSDSRKGMLASAARVAKASFRQVKSLYCGETADPRSSVADKLRTALRERARQEAEIDETARSSLARFAALHAALTATDEAFYSQEIARLEHVMGRIRGCLDDGGSA